MKKIYNIQNVSLHIMFLLLFFFFISCSKEQYKQIDEYEEYAYPCIVWGISKSDLKDRMENKASFQKEDMEYLYYIGENLEITYVYEFQNGALCTSLIMIPKILFSSSVLDSIFKEYIYLGIINDKSVYINEKENTIATSSSVVYNNNSYYTIGWTQLNLKDELESVDLGLSVKWASCNIGAFSPEEIGNYYAWGEVIEKDEYDYNNYLYNDNSSITGTEYDVAHVKYRGNWRMPTQSEYEELISKCDWTWKTIDDVSGYEVKGANGNTIFLPSGGFYCFRDIDYYREGYYWSSTIGEKYHFANDPNEYYKACGLSFGNSHINIDTKMMRQLGMLIRPVCN